MTVAFAREVFGGIERFLERNAEAALEQHRKLALAADDLQQLEILRIPRDQRETTIEGGGRDQGVWQTDAVLLAQRDGPLHHGLVKWDFLKVGEQTHRLL